MPCYIERIKPPSKADYAIWQSIGYTGTWEEYCSQKNKDVGQTMFVCGDLGPHCADCAAGGEFLCDFPVGEGKTCDRSMCSDHATEIGPEIHYCNAHHQMWQDFKARGGVDAVLKNVIAFKCEK